MRSIACIILFALAACNSAIEHKSSYWEAQKDSFKYKNRKAFISDSLLVAEYKHLTQSGHPLFKRISTAPVYLYSWQERDKARNEFTVIKDDGELGLKIYYYILDKKTA